MEEKELTTTEENNESETSSKNDETEVKEAKVKKEKHVIDTSKGGLVWSIWNFLEAALIFALGVICFVFIAKAESSSNKSEAYIQVISTIIMIAGIFLIVGGALKIIVNFLPVIGRNVVDATVKAAIKSKLSYDLVIGGTIELAAGVAIVVGYNNGLRDVIGVITTFLAVFSGTLLIIAGLSLVLFAVGFIVSKLYKIYLPIIEIVFGAALIALGIVVICLLAGNTDLTSMIALIILGVILVLAGVAMAILTIGEIVKARRVKGSKQSKEENKEDETEVVEDVEVVENKEENK